jgi:hypothetical protein
MICDVKTFRVLTQKKKASENRFSAFALHEIKQFKVLIIFLSDLTAFDFVSLPFGPRVCR